MINKCDRLNKSRSLLLWSIKVCVKMRPGSKDTEAIQEGWIQKTLRLLCTVGQHRQTGHNFLYVGRSANARYFHEKLILLNDPQRPENQRYSCYCESHAVNKSPRCCQFSEFAAGLSNFSHKKTNKQKKQSAGQAIKKGNIDDQQENLAYSLFSLLSTQTRGLPNIIIQTNNQCSEKVTKKSKTSIPGATGFSLYMK